MRAPFQILAISYRIINGIPLFCVLCRSDAGYWQFIAGGGEDAETPLEAAKREIFEEAGVIVKDILQLTFMTYVPASCIAEHHRKNWPDDTYVLPEHCFAFECNEEIKLSHEHTECRWVTYDEACGILYWQSNKVALYELKCRLEGFSSNKKNYALIFIDGTICDDRHRLSFFGTDEFNAPKKILQDKPVPGSVEFLRKLSSEYNLIYIGARSPGLMDITKQWLASCGFPDGELYLGATQRERLDIVKEELKHKTIVVGIGDRWDDNQLHLEIGCQSIIVKEYAGDWDFVLKHVK